MANYNHEILVNYLRDVYSMELLVRKIEDDIHSTREDIQCEQALVEKVESTPIPAEGNISPKKDITPYMIAGFLILFISFGFFTLPSIGAISGILGIGVSIILFSCAGSVSSDNTKMQEEEKEKIKENFQRDVEEYEHMLALANDCRSVLPSQIDDYNAAVSHLQEAKEKLQSVYSANIIPNKYRSVYVAYYLYDYISSSHETDIDRVLQTMLLDQIIAKLDKIIAQQEEIILNQRMQLAKQDAFASSGRDYHFYITDASGDGRVLEYDCNDPARPLTVTPSRSVTNFFVMYKDNVLPNQRNGVYGHGRERYDAIEEILDANAGSIDREIAWQALQAASQAPNPKDVTSNTQWSILYDNTALTAEAVIRRDWNTKTSYDLVSNVAVTDVG